MELQEKFNEIFIGLLTTDKIASNDKLGFRRELMIIIKRVDSLIGISRIDVLDEQNTFFNSNHLNDKKVTFFQNSTEAGECFKYKCDISAASTICIDVYLNKGVVIDEMIKNNFSLICNAILTILSRLEVNKAVEDNYKKDISVDTYNDIGIVEKGEELYNKGVLSDYALVFLNIKEFRYVSKLVGVKNINVFLRSFVRTISKYLIDDEFIGRLGGDNFAVLLKKERVKEFTKLYESIDVTFNETVISIKSRIGIYEAGENDNIETCIELANVALVAARKIKKCNNLYFNDKMRQSILRAKEITYNFEESLKHGGFEVFFQPKVDIRDNSLYGAEALSRWISESYSPAEFVPVLEEENLIGKLDFYVLECVCRRIKEWQLMGLDPVPVSINISRNNLSNPDLADQIEEIIDSYDIDHKYIEVEITESSTADGMEDVGDFIRNLKEKNIKVALDDFGTGYSSLGFLADMEVDTIKVDKSFLHYDDDKSKLMMSHIVGLINELGLNQVVEGVEREDQVELLKSIGCKYVQGYYYDRPLRSDEYAKRLELRKYYK